jgi:hypothetical protein
LIPSLDFAAITNVASEGAGGIGVIERTTFLFDRDEFNPALISTTLPGSSVSSLGEVDMPESVDL